MLCGAATGALISGAMPTLLGGPLPPSGSFFDGRAFARGLETMGCMAIGAIFGGGIATALGINSYKKD